MLHEVQEPNLFVFRKQKRDGPEKVTPISAYYILDGSIYQAPNLHNVIGSRVVRALYHISKAFSEAATKLEKIGYDNDVEGLKSESKGADDSRKGTDVFNAKEIMRINHILATVQRKLPPAPPPPPVMPVVAIDNVASVTSTLNDGVQTQPVQQQTGAADTTALGKQALKASPAEQPSAKRVKLERV